MTYKGLVFFDLDGTLYNAHSEVDAAVAIALRQLRANNYLPIIATGRSPLEIQDALATTGIDSFICLNGSYIQFEGQSVYQGTIPTPVIEATVATAKAAGEAVAFYNDQAIRITAITQAGKDAYNYVNSDLPPVDPDYYLNHPVYMMLILTNNNDQAYTEPQGTNLTFYRNTPYSIDTVEKDCSKQTGIKTLIKSQNLSGIPTYAFGDGTNDLPMLDYVDYPTVMGNGIPEAKAKAKYITSKNTEGGIIKGLRHWGLI
ncbi:Cof-type HAD-IIB family hydrolase [Latilactobacillus graminis]|uniref:Cof-like hydrolase family protein n=2 Tax=Latilactobacillus graminis TaxID=60519 RepID=A0AA89I1A3_9LACO|nr:Cof-type HAD-IIB family hydrolase [Latilactobacillus graminis]KRM22436.1 cof-like hydrolase family protein [Latilactobacillus graminis DSM 20719]QFP79395.1 Cof-type HAD-IIB family hydrolase [Latilactobacillus graminis]